MGHFQVRYDSRVVFYDRRGFIRLPTALFDYIAVVNCVSAVFCRSITSVYCAIVVSSVDIATVYLHCHFGSVLYQVWKLASVFDASSLLVPIGKTSW